MTEPIEVFVGSGNVFADLGLPDAEERYAKAMISYRIAGIIQARGLTEAQAAELLEITPAELADVVRGELSGFSIERLSQLLTASGWREDC